MIKNHLEIVFINEREIKFPFVYWMRNQIENRNSLDQEFTDLLKEKVTEQFDHIDDPEILKLHSNAIPKEDELSDINYIPSCIKNSEQGTYC